MGGKLMPTFYAIDVLSDYTSGMIVVKATSKKKAIKLILEDKVNSEFYADCGYNDCKSEHCLTHRLKVLHDNEVAYVYGGG